MSEPRSLTMSDLNGARLAEFLIIEDRVITIASFALMDLIRADQSAPIAEATPGRRWHMRSFLAYLVRVAAGHAKDAAMYPTIESGPGCGLFHVASLNRNIVASELANVLGMEPDEAREALRDHLTFPDA